MYIHITIYCIINYNVLVPDPPSFGLLCVGYKYKLTIRYLFIEIDLIFYLTIN